MILNLLLILMINLSYKNHYYKSKHSKKLRTDYYYNITILTKK